MNERVDIIECRSQVGTASQVSPKDFDRIRPAKMLDARGRSDDRADEMPRPYRPVDDMPSEKSTGSGNQQSHATFSRLASWWTNPFTARTSLGDTGTGDWVDKAS